MKRTTNVLFFGAICWLFGWQAAAQTRITPLRATALQWADSLLATMTQEEKIGQLFMVAAYSNRGEGDAQAIERLITQHGIGGIIFFQGGPVRQALLTNRYQAKSKIPLLIGLDAEWGLGMRLDSTLSFPRQMTLGAIRGDSLLYEMGAEVARQCRRIGVHVNFAPVVDINSNPLNPVIGTRSFGEDKERVARKGIAYMRGMQHHGVMACAKHFPGHGDTSKDSHYDLPVITHSRARMHETELYPFRRLIADSLQSVMVAHLHIPSYDDTPNRPTTLSPAVVTGLLRDSLGFDGLVFTDAMNMQGLAKFFGPGDADLLALLAGNDVLLFPGNVSQGVAAIKKAIAEQKFAPAELDRRVRRILAAKHMAGITKWTPLAIKGIQQDLAHPRALALKSKLCQAAVTVVRNQDNILPVVRVDSVSFASVSIGGKPDNAFAATLDRYAQDFDHIFMDKNAPKTDWDKLLARLTTKNLVIVGLMGMNNKSSEKYGLSQAALDFLAQLQKRQKTVVTVFGNPYSLKYFDASTHLLCAYDEDTLMQKAVPQVIFGAIKADGLLPVTASPSIQAGAGLEVGSIGRLGWALPEEVGMSSEQLQRIDSLVGLALNEEATPGCQVLVAKNGKIVWEKNYGHHTYRRVTPVATASVYDIASVTKVAATLQAVMLLQDHGLLDVSKRLQDYLPETACTNKGDMLIQEILAHQSGLKAVLPFWDKLKADTSLRRSYLSPIRLEKYPLELNPEKLFVRDSVEEWMWSMVLLSDLTTKRGGHYRVLYSDIGFFVLQRVVEKIAGMPLEQLVDQAFYAPLGLRTMTYLPLKRYEARHIVPTEMEVGLRDMLLQGRVHDPIAALQGGVGGHAGLFSNAYDLAVLMQMNIQQGYYGGQRYFRPQTWDRFNTRPYLAQGNDRALGWDKPNYMADGGPTSDHASNATVGHTGFTGTCAWADPEHQLVYIFLSNRIHPTALNNKLGQLLTRKRIHQIVYEAAGITARRGG